MGILGGPNANHFIFIVLYCTLFYLLVVKRCVGILDNSIQRRYRGPRLTIITVNPRGTAHIIALTPK